MMISECFFFLLRVHRCFIFSSSQDSILRRQMRGASDLKEETMRNRIEKYGDLRGTLKFENHVIRSISLDSLL